MRRPAAWLVMGTFVIGMATTFTLHVLAGSQTIAQTRDDLDVVLSLAAFTGLGTLIISRQRDNVMGWLFCSLGLMLAVFPVGDAYATYAMATTGQIEGAATLALWMGSWYWLPLLTILFVYIPMLYPDGRFLSPRWKYVALIPTMATVGLVVLGIFAPTLQLQEVEGVEVANPFGQLWGGGEDSRFGVPLTAVWAVGALAGIVSVFVRFRRSRGDERMQMKWFAFVAALLPVASLVEDVPFIGGILSAVTWVALPVAVGVAMLKYRLYEIDVVINRTLVFGGLAGFITLAYVGVVVGIGTLLGRGDEPNLALSIAATALVAVAFQPVRERLTRVANRLVYGRRATPYQVLSDFSAHLGSQPASEATLAEMARLLALGTGAAATGVWLDLDGRLVPAATWPSDTGHDGEPHGDAVVDVAHEGVRLGALTLSKKRGEQITPVEQALIDDLAAQAGLVLLNLRLNAELRQRLVDLRESRRRLVAAQDTERRRLERDLHDGAQQQLVALKIKLGLAKRLADQERAPKAAKLVEQLSAEADEAVATLRSLAHGIYPPLLASDGLPAALEAAARRVPIPVTVTADGIGRFPPDVEAAVYYCVLEALQNITKYANATSVTVTLSTDDDTLTFAVADDGTGFDPTTTRPGAGTTNMTDRLDALDGTLTITSTPGHGTTVTGRVSANLVEASA